VGVAVLLAVSVAVYMRVGWWRMESACNADPPGANHSRSVALGWSWRPLGFQCTYGDGSRRTSLWF
jgi:hypothetical protein